MPQSNIHPWKLRETKRCFQDGGIIAYPTEAIYGLGCDPLNWWAVKRLLTIKQRSIDKGLILIAADFEQLRPFVKPLSDKVMQPVFDSWPGPNTWLLPAADGLPFWLKGQYETLAVRVTNHPIAADLCQACDSPLVSTSANVSTRKPALNAMQVYDRLGDGAELVINGPCGGRKQASVIRHAESGAVIRG